MEAIAKISEKIIADAKAQAEKTIDEAKISAAARVEEIKATCEKEKAELQSALDKQLAEINGSAAYEEARDRKNALGETKVRFFESIIEKAKAEILSLPDDEYCDFMYSIFTTLAKGENGVISFGDKDITRLSGKFFEKISKEVPLKKGDTLPGYGFLIKYDGFTENAFIDNIFEDRKSELVLLLSREL